MSETPRDPDDDATGRIPATYDPADEPVTGAPVVGSSAAGSSAAGSSAAGSPAAGSPAAGSPAVGPPAAGSPAAGSPAAAGAPGRPASGWRRMFSLAPLAAGGISDPRQRRRRQWFVAAISVGAAIIVIALCAGALSVVSAVDGVRDRAADARDSRRQQEQSCMDLERRLNRLIPPGATTAPVARATAVRDENTAVRIYVDGLHSQPDEDAWRQLLDARTVFADALDRQAKSRTPAFYVAPRTTDGLAVTDELTRRSPASCAGSIRRLAAPDL